MAWIRVGKHIINKDEIITIKGKPGKIAIFYMKGKQRSIKVKLDNDITWGAIVDIMLC